MSGLRKNDMVAIIAGDERGKTGKILKVFTDRDVVLIERLNLVKKHVKPSQKNPQGGIVEKEAPLHGSNVMLLCKKCNKGVRVQIKTLTDGSKVRACRKCGEVLDSK